MLLTKNEPENTQYINEQYPLQPRVLLTPRMQLVGQRHTQSEASDQSGATMSRIDHGVLETPRRDVRLFLFELVSPESVTRCSSNVYVF